MTHSILGRSQICFIGLLMGSIAVHVPILAYCAEKSLIKSNKSAGTTKDKELRDQIFAQAEYHFSLAQGYSNEGATEKAIEE